MLGVGEVLVVMIVGIGMLGMGGVIIVVIGLIFGNGLGFGFVIIFGVGGVNLFVKNCFFKDFNLAIVVGKRVSKFIWGCINFFC